MVWSAYLIAAGAVTLAEMGDKTQLLAMAFASRYKAFQVLIGVFVATVLNHALAVALGYYITTLPGMSEWIRGIAALSFIFFGLWTLRGDKLDGEDKKPSRFGPILTVTFAFFMAELGDKTQLATISLAAQYPGHPVAVLMGTTTGMIIADSLGILLGAVLYRFVPKKVLFMISAAAFMVFGYIGCYQALTGMLALPVGWALAILTLLILITAVIGWRLIRRMPAIASDEGGALAVPAVEQQE